MKPPSYEPVQVASEPELATIADALAGRTIHPANRTRLRDAIQCARDAIEAGDDPLGETFCRVRSPEVRRRVGAVYTPRPIVDAMVRWAAGIDPVPVRIVDPGTGSGRFLLAAGRAFPNAKLLAVEPDPLARRCMEANAKVLGMQRRLTVWATDYRSAELSPMAGPTLFLGNPPYVRHHDISKAWKQWFADAARELGLNASKLAGMHVHFLLKTCQLAKPGDYGAFITAAEWLDVNYGDLVRRLLAGQLGGVSVHVIRAGAMPFNGTAATGAVACFRVGETHKAIRLCDVSDLDELDDLGSGEAVPLPELLQARRWSTFLRPTRNRPQGHIELGELFSVHRGQVTGCNRVWVAGAYPGELPETLLEPVVTRARELFDARGCLRDSSPLQRLVSLPEDLDELDEGARAEVEQFLVWARVLGAHRSYVARHRRKWWSVPLRPAAPILCTYMARRPPAFVRNHCGAKHLNIAHGLYPRAPADAALLDVLSTWLQVNVSTEAGRMYAGGLTKFEPKEVERILIPPLEELHDRTATLDSRRTDAGRTGGSGVVSAVAAD